MFKIAPIQDKKIQRDICDIFGATMRESAFAYLMCDNDTGELMGMSQFEILAEGGVIYDIREAEGRRDNEAMFILGRQTMNFIDLCGIHKCYALPDAACADLLSSIGFKTREGEMLFCDMTGMFAGNCGNH